MKDKNLDTLAQSGTTLIEIKENENVKKFAQKVAKVLKEEYGYHNLEPFITELKKEFPFNIRLFIRKFN